MFNFLVSIAGIERRVTAENRAKKVCIGGYKVNLVDLYIIYLTTKKLLIIITLKCINWDINELYRLN